MKQQKRFGMSGIVIGLILIFILGAAIYLVSRNKNSKPVVRENTIGTDSSAAIIDYKQGIKIEKSSDVKKLRGASDSFKEFILKDLKVYEKDFKFPGCNVVINVMKIYNDEFALGGIQQCETESDHIWKKENNQWAKVLVGLVNTPKWSCSGVDLYQIPNILIPECME